jgi:subtilisin-like proprotein convertase family protein
VRTGLELHKRHLYIPGLSVISAAADRIIPIGPTSRPTVKIVRGRDRGRFSSKERTTSVRTRLLALVLLFIVSLPLVAGVETADARRRTVTKTFRNTAAIAIPGTGDKGPGDLYPSEIVVSGFKKPRILDVNVTLRGLTHSFANDIDALLVAPDGTNAMFMSDAAGNGEPVTDVTFNLDDEAKTSIDLTTVSGTYQPFDRVPGDTLPDPAPAPSGAIALSVFDGIDPNGTWKLYIADDGVEDTGTLSGGWELQIKARR